MPYFTPCHGCAHISKHMYACAYFFYFKSHFATPKRSNELQKTLPKKNKKNKKNLQSKIVVKKMQLFPISSFDFFCFFWVTTKKGNKKIIVQYFCFAACQSSALGESQTGRQPAWTYGYYCLHCIILHSLLSCIWTAAASYSYNLWIGERLWTKRWSPSTLYCIKNIGNVIM